MVLSTIFYSLRLSNGPVNLCGLLACVSSLVFTAAPLVLVADVIKSKSSEKLPFLLIISSFFVSISWFFYGFILKDAFIQVPNGIGTMISGVQLSLFVLYPSKTKLNKEDVSQINEILSINFFVFLISFLVICIPEAFSLLYTHLYSYFR